MPNYTPALRPGLAEDIAANIVRYFRQGFSNAEIIGFLATVHGHGMALRTLKRWLKRMGLKRARRVIAGGYCTRNT